MFKSYIVIPIYSDPNLHPLHKNNKLSLLYTREIDLKEGTLYKGEFICARDHVDLRKMVHMMKKQGYPIEKLQCDCDYKYIHSQYYWEFAIQVNPQ